MSNLQQKRDRALARRVASGDHAAFDEFFHEYFPRLYRFTLSRVDNDESLAEEIVQRTLCIVVRKMGTYRGEALLFSWLCQICRSEMSAIFKRLGREARHAMPLEDNPAVQAAMESLSADLHDPATTRQREEVARFVRVTLEFLPSNYATALEMKYIRGCSVAEIGERLGIGTKAAESVLTRARAAFKEGFRSLWDFEPEVVLD
jgi:RNA polymerase sigma-70 factor (ECF subfamily)